MISTRHGNYINLSISETARMSNRKIEDVLLQISQIRHKKNDGTLYVMKERIVFMVDGKDERVALSHNYQDIKSELNYFIIYLNYHKNFNFSAKNFAGRKGKNSTPIGPSRW